MKVVTGNLLYRSLHLRCVCNVSYSITTLGNLWRIVIYSIISLFHSQVKQESLGISTRMFLKVDIESGKLYFKKSKDGTEDKYFVHNKSTSFSIILLYF